MKIFAPRDTVSDLLNQLQIKDLTAWPQKVELFISMDANSIGEDLLATITRRMREPTRTKLIGDINQAHIDGIARDLAGAVNGEEKYVKYQEQEERVAISVGVYSMDDNLEVHALDRLYDKAQSILNESNFKLDYYVAAVA